MNTQPVPTFPVVAGLEKYYGMTIDELIEKFSTFSNSIDSINSWDSLELEPLSEGMLRWFIVENSIHTEESFIFMKELCKIAWDKNNDIELRASAYDVYFKLLLPKR
jgi:hypothetical protein